MGRRPALRVCAAAASFVAVGGLAACSSPSDGLAGTRVPATDVVSAVRTDARLHAELPAAVRAAGTLSFGTPTQPGTAGLPYIGSAHGATVGLHVDLAEAVSKVLGVRADRQNGTFATIVPGVQNGRFDVGLANLGVTAEREQVVDYATYLDDGQAFLASSQVHLTRVTALTDLCGLTIATSPGSTFQQILTDGANDCGKAGKPAYTVQYFSTPAPILLGLSNGKVDVEFGPTLSARYDALHVPGTRFLGQFSATPVGMVTAKGSPLAPVLRQAVDELIRTGAYARILAKWNIAGSAIARSELNPKPSL